ncbi:Nucleoside-diphosphate-sugar pyrophosphorylase family protein [Wenzhouxiangella marina]|uniref:Nucleoside-diphosphate-sugar pyrophosphorylase family protein n=2 Tax=Wenzhouxiangella marina TaxID=1579979 RepID=A0A0K0XYX0_9GAMM|nr:Nucleoside-diphosphate-sugar pyrophosphorylase family protein [Wenzhouxiangella marina]
MLLAAGRGERLRPLTDALPKPLIEVGGKALIEHHLAHLVEAGVDEVVINLGWLGEQIRERLGNGERYGLRIRYSVEPPGALETAGGIIQALELLGPEPFLIVSTDVLSDYPFASLIDAEFEGLGHLVLVDNPPHHPAGDFGLRSGRITRDEPRLTFSGIACCRPEWFAGLAPGRRALRPLFEQAIDAGRLSGEHYPGKWLDVGTPERLARAREEYYSGD